MLLDQNKQTQQSRIDSQVRSTELKLMVERRRNALAHRVDLVRKSVLGADILLGKRADDRVEHDVGAPERRDANVEQENGLDQKVKGKPVQYGIGPELNHVQEGKHHPVGQELGVVGRGLGVESNQRVVAWHDEASEVQQELAEPAGVEEDGDKVEGARTDHGVGAREASALFKLCQELDVTRFLGGVLASGATECDDAQHTLSIVVKYDLAVSAKDITAGGCGY